MYNSSKAEFSSHSFSEFYLTTSSELHDTIKINVVTRTDPGSYIVCHPGLDPGSYDNGISKVLF